MSKISTGGKMKNSSDILSIIPFVLLNIFVMLGCGVETEEPEFDYFIVKVDSIKHQQSVLVGDTIVIHLFGTIGTDGCHSFHRFEDYVQPNQLDLTVWGKRARRSVCPDVMVYLNEKYKVVATQRGWYYIRIHQPDGSILRDSVIVN